MILLSRVCLFVLVVCGIAASSGLAFAEDYFQDFDGFPDGTTVLGDGSVMAGSASVQGGQLRLTLDGSGFESAGFWIGPLDGSAHGWEAEFDYTISSTGIEPADGFSFNYGDIEDGTVGNEEGFPVAPNLSFEMDTFPYDNPLDAGAGIAVNGSEIPGGFNGGAILNPSSSVSGTITITVDAAGLASFTSTGALTNANFSMLPSGYSLDDSLSFALGSRTGGFNETVLIDNLRIDTGDCSDHTEQTRLTAADMEAFDQFGSSLSVSGGKAVVGAPFEDAGGVPDAGAAYVFDGAAGGWPQLCKLNGLGSADQFGSSVSVSGNTVVVGAPLDDPPGFVNAGAAYVYSVGVGSCLLDSQLEPSDGETFDEFGSSVSVSGDTAVVGAPLENAGGVADAGAAYVFDGSVAGWPQLCKLEGLGNAGLFGSSVSVSGDRVVVGAPLEDPQGIVDAGAAYVYEILGVNDCPQLCKLEAVDMESSDKFGSSVSVSGDTVLVGAPLNDPQGVANAGAAYVYEIDGMDCLLVNKLEADQKNLGEQFGSSVAVSGNTAAVGAPFQAPGGGVPSAGAAYLFRDSGVEWSPLCTLVPLGDADLFGRSVSASGDTVIVGAPLADDVGGVSNAGAAYVFGPEASAAVSVTGLVWSSKTQLVWDPQPLASYNLYRLSAVSLIDGNGDGVADDYGDCFLPDIASPAGVDVSNPVSGSVHFYLVTAEDATGEGTLGNASNGLERPNLFPCQ